MKKLLLLAVALLVLTGCEPSEEKAIELAKKEIAADQLDPESTQFRKVRIQKSGKNGGNYMLRDICGEFNTKNVFGAYVGYRHFRIEVEAYRSGFFISDDDYHFKDKDFAHIKSLSYDENCELKFSPQ